MVDYLAKSPCSWIGRLNIAKMSILSKLIYKLNRIPIKISARYIDKIILKCIWKNKGFTLFKVTLKERRITWKESFYQISILYSHSNYKCIILVEK